MPSLGADMQFGTIVDWRVKPGDAVKRGDVVALVETEKGVIEVEIFENGVIESLVVQPGQKVPVGATLATLQSDGQKVEAQAAPASAAIAPVATAAVKEEKPPFKAFSARWRRKLVVCALHRWRESVPRNSAWIYQAFPAPE